MPGPEVSHRVFQACAACLRCCLEQHLISGISAFALSWGIPSGQNSSHPHTCLAILGAGAASDILTSFLRFAGARLRQSGGKRIQPGRLSQLAFVADATRANSGGVHGSFAGVLRRQQQTVVGSREPFVRVAGVNTAHPHELQGATVAPLRMRRRPHSSVCASAHACSYAVCAGMSWSRVSCALRSTPDWVRLTPIVLVSSGLYRSSPDSDCRAASGA